MSEHKHCECGCSHVIGLNDNGPCATFEKGANGRCVGCDHSEECHAKKKLPKLPMEKMGEGMNTKGVH